MKYLEYARIKTRYDTAREQVEELIGEAQALFDKTQPRSVPFDKDRVDGGGGLNAMDEYLISMERKKLAERIELAQLIAGGWSDALKRAEEELRASPAVLDMIYTAKWLDGRKNAEIMDIVHYSERQIYRAMRAIEANLAENGSK